MNALLHWVERSDTALVVASHDPAVAVMMETVWRLDYGRLAGGA
jgi:ABC-type lipoprotein export system ATPase subunit